MADVVMPRLSESMEEGTILRWLRRAGEEVRRGDELAEIETDKATMTYEADADGVLEIVAEEGETLPVGSVIARLSAVPAVDGSGNGAQVAPPAGVATSAQPAVPTPALAGPVDDPSAPAAPSAERVMASPLARRIAREQGVELGAVAGSGPGGRVVRADVEASAGASAGAPEPETGSPSPPSPTPEPAPAPAAPAEAPAPRGTAKGEVTHVELTRAQQVVARRMAESKATIPDYTLTTEVDMERCVDLHAQMKALHPDVVPTFNDMVVKACAVALREFPRVNGAYRDGRFELYSRVNVGMAVAAQDSLVVPTIFDADRKSLGDIAHETRALAEKVRGGSVTPPELSGATFTVSNLGMYGVTEFSAVINPPQAAILAVGAIDPRPVVHDGELAVRHRMALTLSCDHRILYGAEAASFLARMRGLLEQPVAAFVIH